MMSSSSITKAKANWIPAFHEIFVDSCLEQTLKGNKPGTHFTKEGWRNIVESFYKRTGLRYDKKQMKNHWDSTKEQWKVWCKLIESSIMKWDPERNMFGASDKDWANYIQANPEAAQFQFKELQHADKLKIIFNGTITAGDTELRTQHKRQNNSSTTSLLHNKEPATRNPDGLYECPTEAVLGDTRYGHQLASEQSSSVSKPKATWLPVVHEIFLDLCFEETLKGNRPGTHFTKEGWRNIVESFQQKTGLRYDRIQLKNHWDSTKEQWKIWCKLIDTSHMEWDPNIKSFGASEEDWENYLQENPEAAQFRFKELQNTDKLEVIFDGTMNTGETDPPIQRRWPNDSSASSVLQKNEPGMTKLYKRRRQHDRSPTSSLSNINEPATANLEKKTDHLYDVESRSVTIRRSLITIQPTQGKPDYSIGQCIECLDGMEELEQGSDLYLFALDLFLKKEYREIFLELKEPSVRIAWLQRLQSFSPPMY